MQAHEALTLDIPGLVRTVSINDPQDSLLTGRSVNMMNVPISVEVSEGGYELYLGEGEYPSAWSLLVEGGGSVNGVVHTLDVSGPTSGFYALKIKSKLNERFENRQALIVSNDIKDGWDLAPLRENAFFLSAADTNADADGKQEIIFNANNMGYMLDENGRSLAGWLAV